MAQAELFGDPRDAWPDGLELRDNFIDAREEATLLVRLGTLALAPAIYRGYTARREVASFGAELDDDAGGVLRPGAPLPDFLQPLAARAATWLGVPEAAIVHALVTRYAPGTPLGWHRDAPAYGSVFGLSLAAPARMQLRPHPTLAAGAGGIIEFELPPRSAYLLRRRARWGWEHRIVPPAALRWSVTLRTRRGVA